MRVLAGRRALALYAALALVTAVAWGFHLHPAVWYDGPPPGKNPFGIVIHTDTVFAVIGQNPVAREDGYVHVFGECRNMDDHREDASVNVTDQLVN